MARRTLTSPKFWTLGTAATGLVGLVLLFGPGPDTSAHPGHTATVWEYEWKPGTVVYEWHHRNWYTTSTCIRYNHYTGDCDGWKATGNIVEPRPPCATVPAWSATRPSGSTCDLHQSWVEDGTKYDWERHSTERTSAASRCQLPGSGLQPASRSSNTSPPGGQSTVYQSTNTAPSQYQGSARHCGWWTSRGSHDHATTTTTTEPDGTTTTTEAAPGNWSGSCSYDFTVGTSAAQPLPTYSDSRVSRHSYSGATPAGMSVSGSSSLTLSGRPSSIAGTLAVSRGTITASISGGDDETLACVFRVRTTTVTTDPEPEPPPQESGWSGVCYEELDLGEYYGTRQYPEIYLPYYLGSSWDDRHYYSGRRPRGIIGVAGDGEAALAGTALAPGTYNGWVNARVGRVRHRAPCVIYVDPGTWRPEFCEFFLEVDRVYDITMPYLVGPRVDYYYNSGSLPPGLTREGYRIKGVPAIEGVWSPRWVASITGVSSRDRPSTTCTFYVEQSTPPGWSGHCDWTFTVGTSYTRALPVADGATNHLWTGDEPDGMRMRFVRIVGGWGQQLSGTPTSEGTWTGTLTPYNTSEDMDPIDCSFEVLPGPDVVECSRTIPSDQIDAVRDAVAWRTDVPRAAAHSDIPGGNHLITTGDPGVGGGSPRIWPWWASDDDLTVTDTTGCEWEMTEIISSAHPLFVWYDNDMNVIRNVAPGLRTQWLAMSSAQRGGVEAADRRLLKRVGLDAPEDEKWLGASCEAGDTPGRDCVWGIPFPGVWQWSLTIRYRSPEDYRQRDLTIASGTTRFWRFSDGAVRP